MIRYNNISRPFHYPPVTSLRPPPAKNLGGSDPQPPRIDAPGTVNDIQWKLVSGFVCAGTSSQNIFPLPRGVKTV